MNERCTIESQIEGFAPPFLVNYLTNIVEKLNVDLCIVKPRKTKLGDCKIDIKNKRIRISINNDLNQYSFSITLLHELAHAATTEKYGRFVKPHGREWKNEFKEMLLPLLDSKEFPEEIKSALLFSLNSMKASSCADYSLWKALHKHDKKDVSVLYLEQIQVGEKFLFKAREYRTISKKRSRYLCEEIASKKQYLIHRLAKIKTVE